MNGNRKAGGRDGWARLRFAVVGQLLASPPPAGKLRGELERLAQQDWDHPSGRGPVRFSASTIERWFYQARAAAQDPVKALRRRVRVDAGRQRAMSAALVDALIDQHRAHPSWSVQLHHENLQVTAKADPALGTMPSYPTLTRVMRDLGLMRHRRRKGGDDGQRLAAEERETLSYEVAHAHRLWHADFHHARRRVLTLAGEWKTPILLGFLDDHTRLVCHMQWYLSETAEVFAHGLSQALMKRQLPKSLMTDNGSAMMAGEVQEGLHRLGILHMPTRPCSPQQNGKMEVLWASVEGRLMAMLEGEEALNLKRLNDVTVAWVEQDYHRRKHREIGETPLARLVGGIDASRQCPPVDELRSAFRICETRRLRRSDGTVSVRGVRFQVPAAWRHLHDLHVRFARWDLSNVDLVDARTGQRMCILHPLDKHANADGNRARSGRTEDQPKGDTAEKPAPGPAPLIESIMDDAAASGVPPAWIPYPEPTADQPEDNPS